MARNWNDLHVQKVLTTDEKCVILNIAGDGLAVVTDY